MTTESATVDYIKDAKKGDMVWMFDQNGHVHDKDGKYLGRGSWTLRPIEDENRASFIIWSTKYERETGIGRVKNGYSSSTRLFGQKEYEDRVWIDKHEYKVKAAVDRLNSGLRIEDLEMIRQIAKIIGYEET